MRDDFAEFFRRLSLKFGSPESVQKLLHSIPYDEALKNPTMRSALRVWEERRAHCLEASFLVAAILEHQGFPPLVLSLESVDGLDHVVFAFQRSGRWGSIGLSRDVGLCGRAPIFRSPKALAESYIDPYVDETGRVTSFAVVNLDDSGSSWRSSKRNVWKAERFLLNLKHERLSYPEKRHQKNLARFHKGLEPLRRKSWW